MKRSLLGPPWRAAGRLLFTLSWLHAASALADSAPEPSARGLSEADAVALAVSKNLDLEIAAVDVAVADAQRKMARAPLQPRFTVEAAVSVFDKAITADFTQGLSPSIMQLIGPTTPIVVRDQVTSSFTARVVQPLTPLLTLYRLYQVQNLGVDVSRVRRNVVEREVRYQIKQAYLGVLQTARLAEVAQSQVEAVTRQQKLAEDFLRAGTRSKSDLLRVELELARTRQQLIEARAQAQLASGALAVLLRLPIDRELVLTERYADPPPKVTTGLAELLHLAERRRAEFDELRGRVLQAELTRRAARTDLLPQVSALAQYQHNEGGGAFALKDAAFVGAVVTWDLWDGGAKYFRIDEAAARLRGAKAALAKLRETVALDVQRAYLSLRSAEEVLAVARVEVTHAEENYRIETARFEANTSTTTDLLESQRLLTQARQRTTTALYGYYLAMAGLSRATAGDPR